MTTVPNDPYRTGQPPADPGDPTTTIEPRHSMADQTTGASGPREAAQHEAARVKDTAADAARDVTGTAKEQGAQVVSDVRDQAQRLTRETRTQLADQAMSQRDRAVGSLRSMSDELRTMAEKADQPGSGSQLVHKSADYAQQLADYLAEREPGQLVDGLRGFARRRPGVFLLGAAAAGVVVGRLARGAVDAHTSEDRSTTPEDRSTPQDHDELGRGGR